MFLDYIVSQNINIFRLHVLSRDFNLQASQTKGENLKTIQLVVHRLLGEIGKNRKVFLKFFCHLTP